MLRTLAVHSAACSLAERARATTERIFDTTLRVYALADADGVPPVVAADRLAERRIASIGRLSAIRLPGRA